MDEFNYMMDDLRLDENVKIRVRTVSTTPTNVGTHTILDEVMSTWLKFHHLGRVGLGWLGVSPSLPQPPSVPPARLPLFLTFKFWRRAQHVVRLSSYKDLMEPLSDDLQGEM